MGEMRNAHIILVGKPERKDRLGDLGVDGKIILRIRCKGVDWIHVAQDKIQWGSCEYDNKPSGTIKDG
jgi:hypothetical protein